MAGMLPCAAPLTPGPRGVPLLGSFPAFARDPLGFLLGSAARYGDVVRFPGLIDVYLLRRPEHVLEVLEDSSRFPRMGMAMEVISLVVGDGLITSEGPAWADQRRVAQPLMQDRHLVPALPDIEAQVDALVAQWRGRVGRGEALDVVPEMRRFAFLVFGQLFFSAGLEGPFAEFAAAVDALYVQIQQRLFHPPALPLWIPSPGNREFHRHVATLDRVVLDLIRARREGGGQDLLGRLVQAKDPRTGQPLSDRQVRDQALNLLVLGYETTFNALAFCLGELARRPELARALREAGRVPLDDEPGEGDPPLVDRVFLETLRLYPTAWILTRSTRDRASFGGYELPAGAYMVLSPYVTHRHPEFWPRAEDFDPDRHLAAAAAARPRGAFLPFGVGPHRCLGARLATLEARALFPRLVEAFDLAPVDGRPMVPAGRLSLEAEDGVWLRVTPRG